MAATTMAFVLGASKTHFMHALATFGGVPGRLQHYMLPNNAHCYIDYAHNPSSFRAVLSTLRSFTQELIVVFGAGGERDTLKRPLMGTVAAELADIIIVTTDNPRSENPHDIVNDIIEGVPHALRNKIVRELDRAQAIKKAYALSKQGTIIALLGKGPDEYQLIDGVKTYFSEREIIERL